MFKKIQETNLSGLTTGVYHNLIHDIFYRTAIWKQTRMPHMLH